MSEETSTSGLLSITKLSGSEGYANWAFRVKNSLKYKKLWKCVLGEKSGDPDADDQALSIISLACNDIVKDDIIECTSAKEAWEILAAKFVRKTPAAKVSLYCALTSLKCSDLAGVRELLNQFQVIVRKLKELKVEMDDDMYSIVLLKALPESFEQFKVAIMTRDELPSLDEIKSKVEEETHRQLQQVPPHQEEQVEQALMTSGLSHAEGAMDVESRDITSGTADEMINVKGVPITGPGKENRVATEHSSRETIGSPEMPIMPSP